MRSVKDVHKSVRTAKQQLSAIHNKQAELSKAIAKLTQNTAAHAKAAKKSAHAKKHKAPNAGSLHGIRSVFRKRVARYSKDVQRAAKEVHDTAVKTAAKAAKKVEKGWKAAHSVPKSKHGHTSRRLGGTMEDPSDSASAAVRNVDGLSTEVARIQHNREEAMRAGRRLGDSLTSTLSYEKCAKYFCGDQPDK
jgi:hypothetical protein